MGSGGPLPSGQRRWLTLYYARHTWAEFDAQDLPAAMTNDPDAFPSKPRRRAGGSDNGHHETRPQRRRRLGGDAATPSSQNELRPPPTRKAQPQASVGPPAPPKRRLPLAEASFAEPESRPIRDQASHVRGEPRATTVVDGWRSLRSSPPPSSALAFSSYLFGTPGASLPSRKETPTLPRRKTTKALRFLHQLRFLPQRQLSLR